MLKLSKIKAVAKKLKVQTLVPENVIQDIDKGKAHLQPESTYYPTRAAIAKLIQPQRIGMIGLRFGYGAHAMVSQCERLAEFWSWDNESDVPGSNGIAKALLVARFKWLQPTLTCLGQHSTYLGHSAQQMLDLMYIDGSKDAEQVMQDLGNARRMGRMGAGYILLDDINMDTVLAGLDAWLQRSDSQTATRVESSVDVLEIPNDPKGLVLIGPKP
jgi:hypothetical protein